MIKPTKENPGYWHRLGYVYLLKNLNCAQAIMEIYQIMTGNRDTRLLKAVTGLEGGCVGSGSTCGIVSSGALAVAQIWENQLDIYGPRAETRIMEEVLAFTRWFSKRYGSCLCRERIGVDFHTAKGQLTYFAGKMLFAKCMRSAGGTARYLYHAANDNTPPPPPGKRDHTPHCAKMVLCGVRELTGVGHSRLEKLSFIFDGGVAYSGGICGALTGAVMAANLVFGINTIDAGLSKIIKEFTIGHVNLFSEKKIRMPEPFGIGKAIITKFTKVSGGISCAEITGKKFNGPDDFRLHMADCGECRGLIDTAIDSCVSVLKKWA